MSLAREGRHYLVIGGLQWVLDCTVLVALTHAGMNVELSNVIGRICGALLGFWANGRFTFGGDDHALGRRQAMRFMAMWVALTIVSTAAVAWVDNVSSLRSAWLFKPGIELVLGAFGFVISKHWVYRR